MARLAALLVVLCATVASAFMGPASALAVRPAAAAVSATPLADVAMTSVNKKAKAAKRKQKSNRSAVKRFKVTSTGKLLRHYAGKAHLLRRKRPQHLQRLRRVGQVNDAELLTYQKLLLVFPKRK
jgi:large subunit ribosomal protein L35